MTDAFKSTYFNEVVQESLYDKCTLLGKIIHNWNWAFYLKSYGKDLKISNLPQLPEKDLSHKLTEEFEYYWNLELKNALRKNKQPSLLYPIFRVFAWKLLCNSIFSVLPQIFLILQALAMGSFLRQVREFDSNSESSKDLWSTAAAMIGCQFIHVQSTNIYDTNAFYYSLKLRIALSGLIYKKCMRLSRFSFSKTSPGQIFNLMANDINKLELVLYFIPYPIIFLLMTIMGCILLWPEFKYSILIGVSMPLLILPIQLWIGRLYSKFFSEAAKRTDERIMKMNEFLSAIKIIKIYCWELEFAKMIDSTRKKEIKKIGSALYALGVNMALLFMTDKMCVFFCLISYIFFGNFLKAENVFMAFTILSRISKLATLYLPNFLRFYASGLVSFNRIRIFLCLPEVSRSNSSIDETNTINKNEVIVKIEKLFATYEFIDKNHENGIQNVGFLIDELACKDNSTVSNGNNDQKKTDQIDRDFSLTLKKIEFELKPNELMTIVGPVGSGKSSILMAILNELNIVSGDIVVRGKVSYSGQDAWTFAGTIKENILFGSRYDEKKYKEVIRVCALERDMTLFPKDDQTIVGERGIALSGGQRARINLARALYYDADIYLLDDPLSAVDPHVAKHIFKEAIQGYLATNDKIVILVTHQIQFAKNSTKVLLMREGEQIACDNYNTLLSSSNQIEFSKFLQTKTSDQQVNRKRSESNQFGSMASLESVYSDASESMVNSSIDDVVLNKISTQETEDQKIKKRQVIKEVTVLQLSRKVYYLYAKLGLSGCLGPLLIIFFFGGQILSSYSDYFLSEFVTSEEKRNNQTVGRRETESYVDNLTRNQSIIIYSCVIASLFFVSLIRAQLFFKACLTASIKLHDRLFRKVVGSPITFFETNPIGVLLNRVSRDTGIVDELMPFRLFGVCDIATIDLAVGIMVIWLNPYLIFPFTILMILAMAFRNLYLKTAKSIRMLEGVAKSPVIQHISSSLNGLTTIRAFKAQDRFNKTFSIYQNDHSSVYFMYMFGVRWFVFVLDSLQVIFIAAILVIIILFSNYLNPATIGLILISILNFTSYFQIMLKNLSEIETYMTSVERLDQYSSLPQEPALVSTPDKKPPADWPQRGEIEFKNVSMKYFEDEEPVLRNLSFKIESSQKIGVVGRTGAGKSSILSILFRMYDYEGQILIDGIDVKQIGLHDLRKKLAIIPQEPVLFSGTVRSNLDPLGEIRDDSILWNALKTTQLDTAIEHMNGGLDSQISDSGSNFSSGQKQLICLARAILKNSKILVLDEATANVDYATDDLIQQTIRKEFADCTTITIAHRISSVIDSDKIMVMDSGYLKEFDSSYNLLQNNTTIFSSIVNALDKNTIRNLNQTAKLSFLKDKDLQKESNFYEQ